jgi:hypothetical protein
MTMAAGFRERLSALRKKEQRGSRARCLRLTDGSDVDVAARLTALAAPYVTIDAVRDRWLPRGLSAPREAKLDEAVTLLPPDLRAALRSWWLAVPNRANTPNWDIASTCTIAGRKGLLLVEAKAHANELHTTGCTSARAENIGSISAAVAESNAALLQLSPGWALRPTSHFQLCNRFAFGWKLAAAGIPVVLVYLGFLHAAEMVDVGAPLSSHDNWRGLVLSHATGLVPNTVWDATLHIVGTPLTTLIRSLDVSLD